MAPKKENFKYTEERLKGFKRLGDFKQLYSGKNEEIRSINNRKRNLFYYLFCNIFIEEQNPDLYHKIKNYYKEQEEFMGNFVKIQNSLKNPSKDRKLIHTSGLYLELVENDEVTEENKAIIDSKLYKDVSKLSQKLRQLGDPVNKKKK